MYKLLPPRTKHDLLHSAKGTAITSDVRVVAGLAVLPANKGPR